MRLKLSILNLVVLGSLLSAPALATETSVRCKIKTNDVGEVEASGASFNEALSKARVECADRRVAYFEATRGLVNEDRMSDLIDSCVNLECAR